MLDQMELRAVSDGFDLCSQAQDPQHHFASLCPQTHRLQGQNLATWIFESS